VSNDVIYSPFKQDSLNITINFDILVTMTSQSHQSFVIP